MYYKISRSNILCNLPLGKRQVGIQTTSHIVGLLDISVELTDLNLGLKTQEQSIYRTCTSDLSEKFIKKGSRYVMLPW